MRVEACDNCGTAVEVTRADGETLCPRCYTLENLPEYFWKFFRYARRSDLVAILEQCGLRCYGSDTRDGLLETLRENVASGTIEPSVVLPYYEELSVHRKMNA